MSGTEKFNDFMGFCLCEKVLSGNVTGFLEKRIFYACSKLCELSSVIFVIFREIVGLWSKIFFLLRVGKAHDIGKK